jgi:TolA-binding protein
MTGKWFDPKITWQTVIAATVAAAGAALAINANYYSLLNDVNTLRQHDAAQDERFQRVEKSIDQQRGDTKEQLGNIAGDIKEIRNYLMDRQQPQAMRRWTR